MALKGGGFQPRRSRTQWNLGFTPCGTALAREQLCENQKSNGRLYASRPLVRTFTR